MFDVRLRSIFLPAPARDVEQRVMFVCGSQSRFICLERLFQVILGSEKKSGAYYQCYYGQRVVQVLFVAVTKQ